MKNCQGCKKEQEESIKEKIIKLIILAIIFSITFFKIIPQNLKIFVYIVSYILVGYEVIFKSIRNIFKGKIFDENFLMTIATCGAFLINEPEEAVAVMLFYNLGEIFEDLATGNSEKSIINLMNIKPKIANLKTDDGIIKINPEEVKVGDIILVKPGEKIPIDGIIINGKSTINTSAITGEAIPKSVEKDSEVLAGSINETDLLEIKVTKEFKDTAISEIIELVKKSNNRKTKTEVYITKFAKIYTPIVVMLAIFIAFIPPAFIGLNFLNIWIKRALVFLVTSCPCALVLSVPLRIFCRNSEKQEKMDA